MNKSENLITVDEKNKRIFKRIGWALSVLVILSQLGGILVANIGYIFFPRFAKSSIFNFISGQLPIYLIGFPVFVLIIKKIPGTLNTTRKKITLFQFVKLVIISFGAMYIFSTLTGIINMLISELKGNNVINPVDQIIKNANIFEITFFVAILAPIMEEIIFRGFLISKLRQFGDGICIFVSSLAFALFHGNTSQFFYAFALGCIFAYIVLKFGTIRYTIIIHMIINFVGSVVSLHVASSKSVLLYGILIFFTISMVLLSILITILESHNIKLNKSRLYPNIRKKIIIIFGNSGMIVFSVLSLILVIITTVFD